MPFCPQCRVEYREGFTACADCGAPLVNTLPEAPHDGEPAKLSDEPLVLIYEAKDELQAADLKALLEKNGIPVLENYSRFSPITKAFAFPSAINLEVFYRLYTFAAHAEEAKRIVADFLTAYERGDLSLPE
jgi:hypothetical protein